MSLAKTNHHACSSRETNAISRRTPREVMRLARMGSFHASRLSFMRVVLRELIDKEWKIIRSDWQLDEQGVGHAVYTVRLPNNDTDSGTDSGTDSNTDSGTNKDTDSGTDNGMDSGTDNGTDSGTNNDTDSGTGTTDKAQELSLVVFSHNLPDEKRSDRVIATEWDVTFALTTGIPNQATLRRLRANVPVQEEGRVSESEWVLSRANRSVRLFNHTVERLAQGQQPDGQMVDAIGYLMRTTAVYGSGKFGLADREVLCQVNQFFAGPFRAELLAVYLIRLFTYDLVEHLAKVKAKAQGTTPAKLSPTMRQKLGIGNSTGLGMAPFLLTHPALLGNWLMAREEALARVRSLETAEAEKVEIFTDRLIRMERLAELWEVSHEDYQQRIEQLRSDLVRLRGEGLTLLHKADPWNELYLWTSQQLGTEATECLVSLLLEPYPELVDPLADCMDANESAEFIIDGARPVGEIRGVLNRFYGWTSPEDFKSDSANALVWYTSAEKLEPRLGLAAEGLSPYERPLAAARDAMRLAEVLRNTPDNSPIAEVLLAHPELRDAVRRLQILERHPYAEICDNTIDESLSPLDLLRCKLSFFGATRFDPRSDRWLRICMYQGAPIPDETGQVRGTDDWIYPPVA